MVGRGVAARGVATFDKGHSMGWDGIGRDWTERCRVGVVGWDVVGRG